MLATFVVSNISDGTIPGSFRTAIASANADPSNLDQIVFDLDASEMASGITINSPLQISGPVQILGDNIANGAVDEVTIRAGTFATDAFVVNALQGGGITSGFALQDIIIDGAFDDGVRVTRLPSGGELLFNRVAIFNTQDDGIDLSPTLSSVKITIQNSAIALNGAHGILAHNAGNSDTDLGIFNNQIQGNGRAGIKYENFDAPVNIQNNFIGTATVCRTEPTTVR